MIKPFVAVVGSGGIGSFGVRYETSSEPIVENHCQCRECQRRSGTGHSQQPVTFSKPFAVSKYELLFADWDACVSAGGCYGYKPTDQGWGHEQRPVINVSWEDAQQYVAWL